MSKYEAPSMPEDLLPDLDVRIAEIRAKYDQARHEGYSIFQKARAQQASAEDCERRGETGDAKILMDGAQNVVGVRQLDAAARIRWAEARRYKSELEALEAQKAKEASTDGRS